ncbi:MAG: hypothetical protein J7524_22635 [Roseofilum sp. Belize BBD 4]|uniref:IS630 transposase-related protein n=1 Tax=Roseofilum sp. Belize BBD 4 TaxID=2821500 RepID=UPI001B2B6A98|nr:hypothetical protein [Roseofilum sp. Belize BBD 4]
MLKKEAATARRYNVSRWCVYDWCKRPNIERVKVHRRSRKLDWEALRKQVQQKPDALLLERAAETRKKNSTLQPKETSTEN